VCVCVCWCVCVMVCVYMGMLVSVTVRLSVQCGLSRVVAPFHFLHTAIVHCEIWLHKFTCDHTWWWHTRIGCRSYMHADQKVLQIGGFAQSFYAFASHWEASGNHRIACLFYLYLYFSFHIVDFL
jgi:hypothetical protein